jgi:hypothetical protein
VNPLAFRSWPERRVVVPARAAVVLLAGMLGWLRGRRDRVDLGRAVSLGEREHLRLHGREHAARADGSSASDPLGGNPKWVDERRE